MAAMLRLQIRSQVAAAVHARALLAPPLSPPLHRHRAPRPLCRRGLPRHQLRPCARPSPQSLQGSRHIAHLKCPSNPEAVIAFFADSGLTKPEVAAAIARDPRLLCSKVEKTLRPRLAQLRDIGLSPPQISSLIAIAPNVFKSRCMIQHLTFYLSFLGSYDKVHGVLRKRPFLLTQDLECVVKPNMVFLRQCGLAHSDIAKLTSLIILEPEHLKEIVARADKFGVPRYSAMFKHALRTISDMSPERIDAKLDFLKKVLGCSENELSIAVRKLTKVLCMSDIRLNRIVEFLKMDVGLKAEYNVHRPALVTYGLETRLMPRHHVLKVLKKKGLMKKDVDFFAAVSQVEAAFVKRFIESYKDSVPGIADGYAAAYQSNNKKVPPEFQP